MIKKKKSDDAIQLENLSKLISAFTSSPDREHLYLLASGLGHTLNLCMKHIDKMSNANPSPVCPKCSSYNVHSHGKPRNSFYCPKCFKTFSGATAPQFCPKCKPNVQLSKAATTKTRYRCRDCETTYMEGTGVPTDFHKFIYFCHLIYNTKLSYGEIKGKLEISSDTYYRWKKRLAIYFPNTRGYLYEKRG
ncbi:hypothetical protein LI031_30050 [Enterocloster citroniae]|uniref:hypothetical protein n=1 Tax=Enterocloster citroniae TaxID=358743 RepID=UPI001D06B99A|nr:hypothetical protein [Enterocloster citroniae]MCB7068092.1 hypothetical protein [Enterocloster citroniae]